MKDKESERQHPAELHAVIGISGASGSLYAHQLIRSLAASVPGKSYVIVSEPALRVYNQEYNVSLSSPEDLLAHCLEGIENPGHSFVTRDIHDIGATPASGSSESDGMVVVPCSMKTLAAIAHGLSSNLLERAADVTLKERRPLIVVPREAPYSLIHLRNMTALTEAGGIVLPASPAYYQRPQTLDDLGRFMADRILALFGRRQNLFPAWKDNGPEAP